MSFGTPYRGPALHSIGLGLSEGPTTTHRWRCLEPFLHTRWSPTRRGASISGDCPPREGISLLSRAVTPLVALPVATGSGWAREMSIISHPFFFRSFFEAHSTFFSFRIRIFTYLAISLRGTGTTPRG